MLVEERLGGEERIKGREKKEWEKGGEEGGNFQDMVVHIQETVQPGRH